MRLLICDVLEPWMCVLPVADTSGLRAYTSTSCLGCCSWRQFLGHSNWCAVWQTWVCCTRDTAGNMLSSSPAWLTQNAWLRRPLTETHELAERKQQELATLRQAWGLGEEVVEGQAFDLELQVLG